MKIRSARLKMLLLPQGFLHSHVGTDSLTFFRQDSLVGLFQKIHVDCQGKDGEAVYGNVSSSVLKFLHLKIETRHHLRELDANNERNWTIVEDNAQAKIWEDRFVEIAPAAAEAYAREHGEGLLQRTADARKVSSTILRGLDPTKSLSQLLQDFQARRGTQFVKVAERLAEWPGVMQVCEAHELYTVTCCAILSHAQALPFVGQDPLENDNLMWQIELVADGLLSLSKATGSERK